MAGSGNPQASTWANTHGITHPVVTDPVFEYADLFVQGKGSFGIPTYTILNRELEIVSWDGVLDEGLVLDLLSEPVPNVDWPMP